MSENIDQLKREIKKQLKEIEIIEKELDFLDSFYEKYDGVFWIADLCRELNYFWVLCKENLEYLLADDEEKKAHEALLRGPSKLNL